MAMEAELRIQKPEHTNYEIRYQNHVIDIKVIKGRLKTMKQTAYIL